jgi:hypothetical protein
MRSRSSPERFARACGIISLLVGGVAAQSAASPALVVADPAEASRWETIAKNSGWRVLAPAPAQNPDARVQALADAVRQAVTAGGVDASRVYLVGGGSSVAMVFYTISRAPDLWAAALAVEGSPQPALDTDRIFAANFRHVPILWISNRAEHQALARKLREAGLPLEWRLAEPPAEDAALFAWLRVHQREEFPNPADCETNAPAFASCYWIQMTKFDVEERNEVLPSSRIAAPLRAALDLGGFGFKTGDSGPGVLVSMLPKGYSGPLQVGDRIVALDGRPLEDAHRYLQIMAQYTSERPVVVTLQRGRERVRLETRVVLPKRDPVITARVQAQYLPEKKQIQIISRAVTEMKIIVPPKWASGAGLFWNGLMLDKIEEPGCFVLSVDEEILHAARCK